MADNTKPAEQDNISIRPLQQGMKIVKAAEVLIINNNIVDTPAAVATAPIEMLRKIPMLWAAYRRGRMARCVRKKQPVPVPRPCAPCPSLPVPENRTLRRSPRNHNWKPKPTMTRAPASRSTPIFHPEARTNQDVTVQTSLVVDQRAPSIRFTKPRLWIPENTLPARVLQSPAIGKKKNKKDEKQQKQENKKWMAVIANKQQKEQPNQLCKINRKIAVDYKFQSVSHVPLDHTYVEVNKLTCETSQASAF